MGPHENDTSVVPFTWW